MPLHPDSPHQTRPRASARCLAHSCALLALWGPAALGDASVQAQLSARELAWGQPVELTLSAQGDNLGEPDLSVLEPDFQILDRRVERQFAIRNGQRSARMRLGLLLLPRRDGKLTLPAIAFGQAQSEPVTLTVKPGTGQPAATAGAEPFPPQGEDLPTPPDAGWGNGYPGPLPFPPAPFPRPNQVPVPPIDLSVDPWREPRAMPAQREDARGTQASPGLARNPWFWLSLGLAGALAGLLKARRRTAASVERAAEPQPQAVPDSPLELARARVGAAYDDGDAAAAREALLAWARLRWPADPPGNLARLAQRCPAPLREHITRLEMAFFSPEPIPWEREPVPRELAELA